jgi:hypothetical protein
MLYFFINFIGVSSSSFKIKFLKNIRVEELSKALLQNIVKKDIIK